MLTYKLQQGEGLAWQIMATEELEAVIKEMASIMELKAGWADETPRLIFVQRAENALPIDHLEEDFREGLPEEDWSATDLGSVRLWSNPQVPDAICEFQGQMSHYTKIVSMLKSLYPIYAEVQNRGGLPMHAGLVEWNGMGVLLAAPWNTGKSTCCRRISPPWRALCDDEMLIVREKGKLLAHPFPTWSDYIWKRSRATWDVERSVPLSAIFFLEQSETDDVAPIGPAQSAIYSTEISSQVWKRFWSDMGGEAGKSLRGKLLENACRLAAEIPAFVLKVSLTGRFWEKMETALTEPTIFKTNIKQPMVEGYGGRSLVLSK